MRWGPLLTLVGAALGGIALLVFNSVLVGAPETASTTGYSSTARTAAPTTTSSAVASTPPRTVPTPSLAPPAAPSAPPKADYSGKAQTATGAAMTFDVAIDEDKAVAYACDGAAVESWLTGTASGSSVALAGKNGTTFTGIRTGTTVSGTLSINNQSIPLSANQVTSPRAGMYVDKTTGDRSSWIVAEVGSVTGVQRDASGTTRPAGALTPTAIKVTGGDQNVF